MKKWTFFIALLLLQTGLWGQKGILRGRVYNAANNEPVAFATIAVYGTTIGSTSDLDGNFLFTGLEPGYIELRASSVGFDPFISTSIEISNAREVFIDIPLNEANIKLEEVSIRASIFRKTEESPVSLQRISIEEIEKNPGANRDISRVLQSYPGVASTPAQRNDIIVRGGGPSENSFYLDGIEIPNINHFATQGASGGPVGIINADLLREVKLYTGAFPASTGNALSSVIELSQKDGNKEGLKFKGSVGASDLALTLDGPLGEKSSYILSYRRSYLQFLFRALGLPFLPKYNDYQLKLKTRLNEHNELSLISIGSYDNNALNLDANETEEKRFILGYLPESYQWSYTIGLVLKHYREKGFDTWVLSRNYLHNESLKYANNIPSEDRLIRDYNSDEIENKFRYTRSGSFKNGLKTKLGGGLEYAKFHAGVFNKSFMNGAPLVIDNTSSFDLFKWHVFAQAGKKLFSNRLTLSLGIRSDATNYNAKMQNLLKQLSPRFSASYMLNTKWFLNFSTGRYYQLPAYTSMGYSDNSKQLLNRNKLRYIRAEHLVGGLEFLPDNDSRLSLEGFYKHYSYYPFSLSDSVSLASKGANFGLYGNEALSSTGKGRAFGAEFLYRNRDLKGLSLTLSYTLVRSETLPKRSSFENLGPIPTSWDNIHLLNVYGFRKFKGNWQLGFKWRYVGGQPYTPFDPVLSSRTQYWDVTGYPALNYNLYNQLRYNAYHQLDLRIDKTWYLNLVTINLYADVQNVYNYKSDSSTFLVTEKGANGEALIENPDDPPSLQRYKMKELKSTSGTLLPTLGIILSF